MSSFKSTKEVKSYPALHRSLGYIQNIIPISSVLHTKDNFFLNVSLFDYHSDLNDELCSMRNEKMRKSKTRVMCYEFKYTSYEFKSKS